MFLTAGVWREIAVSGYDSSVDWTNAAKVSQLSLYSQALSLMAVPYSRGHTKSHCGTKPSPKYRTLLNAPEPSDVLTNLDHQCSVFTVAEFDQLAVLH